MRDQLAGGSRAFERLAEQARARLAELGFAPDYVEIVDATSLQPAHRDSVAVVIAAAAYLGKARLIDNVYLALRD